MEFSFYIASGMVVLGLIVGVLTGIFGVGGGFLMTPALMILLGVSAPVAVGTGLLCILANSTIGLFKRRGSGSVDVKVALMMSGGCIVGAILGSALLQYLNGLADTTINGRELPTAMLFLLLMFLAVLIFVGVNFLISTISRPGREAVSKGLLDKLKIPPYAHFKTLDGRLLSVPGLLLLGLVAGVMTGLLGIGGGIILMPILVYLVGQDGKEAAGTSLLLVWISAVASVCFKGYAGDIDMLAFGLIFAGGFFGTILGTKIGLALREDKIRFYFVYIIAAAVIMIGWKLWAMIYG